MIKTMRIGTMEIYNNKRASIYVKAEYKEGKLSISGVIGPLRSGNCLGGCGQIDMEFSHKNPEDNDKRYDHPTTPEEISFATGWDKEKWFDLLDIWKEYHLNDMQAECEHQRKNWDMKKELELIEFSWGDKFHDMRNKATEGKLAPLEYQNYQEISAMVLQVTIRSPVKWWSPLAQELLAGEWIKEKKHGTELAIWVNPSEHPEGLLTKECEACGHKYGTKWLKSEVPQEVIEKLNSFPDADITPALI